MAKKYALLDVMATAIAVDRAQGFVKSGYGYYDFEREVEVLDNKTACQRVLNNFPEISIEVTDADRQEAQELKEYFDGLTVMKKLTGKVNGFEDQVGKILNSNEVDGYGVSILASLPNSLRIQKQRDELDEWFDERRNVSEYIGQVGKRGRFDVYVRDVKFIAKYGIHLVTGSVDDVNLIKFFWSKDPDISDMISGKTMSITGFVKEQSISKFSNCKETVINRVKIQEKG